MFHRGELHVQALAGESATAEQVGRAMLQPEVPRVAAEFLEQQRVLFVGHADAAGRVWASVLAGDAGFVTAPDTRTVRVRARPAAGDPLAVSLSEGPLALGLLAIEPATRRRMRINGEAHLDGDVLEVRTEQVYANCPKYISSRAPRDGSAPAASGPARRFDGLQPPHERLIRGADTFFVASGHATDGADVSHRGGNPGFVGVAGNHVSWPDYRGNSMFNTLGNLDVDPHAGLLFADWSTGDVLQLTGTAVVDWAAERVATVPGARRVVDLTVEQVVELPGALGGSWRFDGLARTNPPLAS